MRWDLLIMVLAIWNCIQVPYDIAFEYETPSALFVFNILVDFVFLTDIFVNFRTTYINEETGIETYSWSQI